MRDTEASATPNDTVREEADGENVVTLVARNDVPTGSMSATKTDAPRVEEVKTGGLAAPEPVE